MRELHFQEKMDGFQIRLVSESTKMYTHITIIARNDAGEGFRHSTKYMTFFLHPEVMLGRATKAFNRKNPYGITFDWTRKATIILE
ncbi:hypothetical protein DUK53_16320 [Listeria sp. SHR_NRA_18]|uniref:hypothetical protein n=1 Tax=Listeria sp. SHR_NRA_18 TaxID=2269046 RepID=UPI00051CDD5E|nr:hypothetical protein [Listeria sp. SHR_NRA_18]KGL44467.1 hypothetical protein EP56_07650 [Listeriaceae bacterium FSL A5-0209]RQW65419.1 hypothetical protein DUK53_16320 [Listeria sp. SHR_NRA_18]